MGNSPLDAVRRFHLTYAGSVFETAGGGLLCGVCRTDNIIAVLKMTSRGRYVHGEVNLSLRKRVNAEPVKIESITSRQDNRCSFVADNVKGLVDRVIDRAKANAKEGIPLDESSNPHATLRSLNVVIDSRRPKE